MNDLKKSVVTMKLKSLVRNIPVLYNSVLNVRHYILVLKSLRNTILEIEGNIWIKKDIIGQRNSIYVKKNCRAKKLIIKIRGNNNKLIIAENCIFGPQCYIWLEGNDITVCIGKDTTFTSQCHINAQEHRSEITIGKDCMFSNHIIVRTSDSHPIYEMETGQRINKPESIAIGDHVWIAPNVKIMKGSYIPDGCIIGSDSTISKVFNEKNALIVGRPARTVKSKIFWTREKLF